MERNQDLEASIFSLNQNPSIFNDLCLQIFEYQLQSNSLYNRFCKLKGITSVKSIEEIPFLPISFFKSHKILCDEFKAELVFKSSGLVRSHHYIAFSDVYIKSFLSSIAKFIPNITEYVIVGLLPNYLSQGNSSLVYMVKNLIDHSMFSESCFHLSNFKELKFKIEGFKKQHKKVLLFGVAYSLLDFAEFEPDLKDVVIIETGGMKGRRKEWIKADLHQFLSEKTNFPQIISEYGMTELLSQAYSLDSNWFEGPNWMKVLIRELNDPIEYLSNNKIGGINIIDLTNLYSCPFIATDDLGMKNGKQFSLIGRVDYSDIRGCNLLLN